MNIVKSFPRDGNDEGVVLSATCDLCHAKHDSVPAKRPICSNCGQDGCPECTELEMDKCDQCQLVVCRKHWTMFRGFKLCLDPACKQKAIAEQAQIEDDKRKREALRRPKGLRRPA